MGHIAATDVERPCEIVRIADDEPVETLLRHLLADARQLGIGALARELDIVEPDRRGRRVRPIRPDGVDRIGLDGDEAAAGALRGLAQSLHPIRRVQPWIVRQRRAGRQIVLDPRLRRLVREWNGHECRRVDLFARLQRVAAIDDDAGLVPKHDRRPGRTGESGEPGKTLGILRHIFALMLVSARHDEAVEVAAGKLGPQRRKPRRAVRRIGGLVEGLELAPRHHALLARRRGAAPPSRTVSVAQPSCSMRRERRSPCAA